MEAAHGRGRDGSGMLLLLVFAMRKFKAAAQVARAWNDHVHTYGLASSGESKEQTAASRGGKMRTKYGSTPYIYCYTTRRQRRLYLKVLRPPSTTIPFNFAPANISLPSTQNLSGNPARIRVLLGYLYQIIHIQQSNLRINRVFSHVVYQRDGQDSSSALPVAIAATGRRREEPYVNGCVNDMQ
uniref:Uncharacterized protein n=1 Tax=Coccidioides posadasii RMSCC 3488 TaxID=454284 RepID=A0A0J6F8M5_COCPO|nr:hypothetical protein CPAG_05692 [Coccidioides posadasii RMSCC 3488]